MQILYSSHAWTECNYSGSPHVWDSNYQRVLGGFTVKHEQKDVWTHRGVTIPPQSGSVSLRLSPISISLRYSL